MQVSMLLGMFDWIGDFFKSMFDLIPKIMYLLYASLACVMDVLQLFFRKLAGLDVYYVDGKPVAGDLVTNFIAGILGIDLDGNGVGVEYSALSTVFWAFIIFGVIVCFVSIFVAIIKSHYSYDEKSAKGPMQYIYAGGKAVINMVAVPIIVVLGLFVSQAILTALDSITSTDSSTIESLYGDQASLLVSTTAKTGAKTYTYYDIMGYKCGVIYGMNAGQTGATGYENDKGLANIGATTETFSGCMFRVAAYNGNRVREGINYLSMSGFQNSDELFYKAVSNSGNVDTEKVAEMIDTAFVNNLHLKDWMYLNDSGGWNSKYFTNFFTRSCSAFSKFNVGLVWYYYDLWNFNFIVGFAGLIVMGTVFINIIFGLITRLFMCIALFLVAPPLFGLAPLDGGSAAKKWRDEFMKQVLMTYGAVVGMNLMFLILPYINEIDFFNIPIADVFAQTLIIITGLITVKALIATLSSLIGGADANETGGKISKEVMNTTGKAAGMTLGAAVAGAKVFGGVAKTVGKVGVKAGAVIAKGIGKQVSGANKLNSLNKERKGMLEYERDRKFIEKNAKENITDKDELEKRAKEAGYSGKKLKSIVDANAKGGDAKQRMDAFADKNIKFRGFHEDNTYGQLSDKSRANVRRGGRQAIFKQKEKVETFRENTEKFKNSVKSVGQNIAKGAEKVANSRVGRGLKRTGTGVAKMLNTPLSMFKDIYSAPFHDKDGGVKGAFMSGLAATGQLKPPPKPDDKGPGEKPKAPPRSSKKGNSQKKPGAKSKKSDGKSK